MNMTVGQSPNAKNNQLRSYGLSLLFVAMAVGAVGRTIHGNNTVSIGMSIGSGLLSLCAIGLFLKASKSRWTMVMTAVAIIVAGLAFAVAVIYK